MSNPRFFFTGFIFAVLLVHATPKLTDIIGSRNAKDDKERPFQVSLIKNGGFTCGASIIDKKFILTAAHCTDGAKASDFKIGAGSLDVKKPTEIRRAIRIFQHENFTLAGRHDDISLIEVDNPFKFTDTLSSVPLPEQDEEVQPGSKAILSGWGKESVDQSVRNLPKILQVVEVVIENLKSCATDYEPIRQPIFNTNICASGESMEVKQGQCNGDSGGPLTVGKKLVGVVSWSVKDPECGSFNYPGVYTRVSAYIGWIKKGMKG